MATRFK